MKFKNMVFGALASIFVMSIPTAKSLLEEKRDVRVVLLGDSGVGKTSLSLRMCEGDFSENCTATVGASYRTLCRNYDCKSIELTIWDTAGQEKYRSLSPIYCRNAGIAVIVFSVDNSGSFDAIGSWFEQLKLNSPSCKKVILVANKTDLEMTVTEEKIRQKAENLGVEWSCCSAKTGDGVSDLEDKMFDIARGILNSREEAERLLRVETRKREKCC
ncbi:MAG: GTP-binding protein [Oscillospiraceae bacterium]|jgi:small GTP-binding protein|nr:GTP-binding protein [Oscillospiraceae bacterium]